MSPPKYVDLIVLAAAFAVFLVGDFPMLGYAVAAVIWLAQRGIQMLAQRGSTEALRNGNRQRAMGLVASSTLGRVWLMATAVLLVGIAQRTAGLSSAILLLALFTISFAAHGLVHLFAPEGPPAGQGAAR